MVPRFSRSHQHGWGIAPPIFFFLKKKTGRARSKRKTLFVQTCPSGQVWGCGRLIASFPQACPVPSGCAVTRLATHAYAASCDASSNSEGASQSVQLLFPLLLHGDGFQRKGPQPLPSGRSGKGSRGKPSRKGFPLASLWGRPVSLGERNGSHTLRSGSLR